MPLFLSLGLGARARSCHTSSQERVYAGAHACSYVQSVAILAANEEVRVCPSLPEQQRACTAIKVHASLQVRIVDGLIATFEAINFVHLPFINDILMHFFTQKLFLECNTVGDNASIDDDRFRLRLMGFFERISQLMSPCLEYLDMNPTIYMCCN